MLKFKAMDESIFFMRATELAAKLRSREIKSLDLVNAHINRIEQTKIINAMAYDLYDEARESARHADRLLDAGDDQRKLLGVPCTVKWSYAYKGKPWAVGCKARLDLIPKEHAPSVQRYVDAGLIPVAISNTSEAGGWTESVNPIVGRTMNPWKLDRTAFGSSGGEAALIAAGCTPVGVGSDFGGSIRAPSIGCGIAGHKGTGGRLSMEGAWPDLKGESFFYNAGGPMARHAADLPVLFRILDGADPTTVELEPKPLPQDLKVFYYLKNGEALYRPEAQKQVEMAVKTMSDLGYEVEHYQPKLLKYSSKIWQAMVEEAGGPPFTEYLGGGKEIGLIKEFFNLAFRKKNHTFSALAMAAAEKIMVMSEKDRKKYCDYGKELKAELKEKLGDNGVIIFPGFPRAAPPHKEMLIRVWAIFNAGIYNVMKLPGTAVCLTREENNLPLGVNISANEGNDELTMSVGALLERPFSPAPVSLS